MSEAMALERMTQMLAELEGYLTSTRVPYLPKYDKNSGQEKTGGQLGDLDLVGLGPAPERHLMVAECKGHGSPEDYQNWFTSRNLAELEYFVRNLSSNINSISDKRWKYEFEKRKIQESKICKPDQIWIVFPGSFFPLSNPEIFGVDEPYYQPFVEKMTQIAQPMQILKDNSEVWDKYETTLLLKAEQFLGQKYNVQVRLLPIHRLLSQLFIGVTKDMVCRRKRYPDTAAEMIRWIAKAISWGVLDLETLQKEIKQVLHGE